MPNDDDNNNDHYHHHHHFRSISITLSTFILIILFSIYLFSSGFLLTRQQLDQKSSCDQSPIHCYNANTTTTFSTLQHEKNCNKETTTCWLFNEQRQAVEEEVTANTTSLFQHKRIFLFIIDAFRFDFVFQKESMPYLHELLVNSSRTTNTEIGGVEEEEEEESNLCLLYKFVADAPTTTSQRLKALTTGSLPTFVDAGKNFDSDAIVEDNWVHQFSSSHSSSSNQQDIKKKKKNIVALGDDTWKHLFPNTSLFARQRLFPSFDVWDLHTLDNSVLQYLDSELLLEGDSLKHFYDNNNKTTSTLKNEADAEGLASNTTRLDSSSDEELNNFEKYDVLIAHFLGVDHAGHRFGVHHEQMASKLKQMDQLLKKIIEEWLPEDSILLMFGDHGMDDHGDHGGNSDLEVNSALFVYSKTVNSMNESKRKLLDSFSSHSDSLFEMKTHREQQPESEPVSLNNNNNNNNSSDNSSDTIRYRTISQIDFVPTISLLMNSPIPYGNLGTVIPEILLLLASPSHKNTTGDYKTFLQSKRELQLLLDAIRVNSFQVWRYLNEYYTKMDSSLLSKDQFNQISLKFSDANHEYNQLLASIMKNDDDDDNLDEMKSFFKVYNMYHEFLQMSVQICRERWASFNVTKMITAIIISITSILSIVIISIKNASSSSSIDHHVSKWISLEIIFYFLLKGIIIASGGKLKYIQSPLFHSLVENLDWIQSYLIIIPFLISFLILNITRRRIRSFRLETTALSIPQIQFYLILFSSILYLISLFSNSFIIYEDRMIIFNLMTHALLFLIHIIVSNNSKGRRRSIVFALVYITCIRLSSWKIRFRSHGTHHINEHSRESLLDNFTSSFLWNWLISPILTHFSSDLWLNTMKDNFQIILVLMAIVFTICLYYLSSSMRRGRGSRRGRGEFLVFWIPVYSVICCILIGTYWILNLTVSSVQGSSIPSSSSSSSLSSLLHLWLPRIVYLLWFISVLLVVFEQWYRKMSLKEKWRTKCENLFFISVIPLLLLKGHTYCSIILLQLIQTISFIKMKNSLSKYGHHHHHHHRDVIHVFHWFLFGMQYFFATGQQNTLNTIQWNSAFVGIENAASTLSLFLSGLLVTLNTFGVKMLYALSLPMIILYVPETNGSTNTPTTTARRSLHLQQQQQEQQEQQQRDHDEEEEEEGNEMLLTWLSKSYALYCVFQCSISVVTMMCAMIHRRHLMVWAIFAPKFIFDTLSTIVVLVVILVAITGIMSKRSVQHTLKTKED